MSPNSLFGLSAINKISIMQSTASCSALDHSDTKLDRIVLILELDIYSSLGGHVIRSINNRSIAFSLNRLIVVSCFDSPCQSHVNYYHRVDRIRGICRQLESLAMNELRNSLLFVNVQCTRPIAAQNPIVAHSV